MASRVMLSDVIEYAKMLRLKIIVETNKLRLLEDEYSIAPTKSEAKEIAIEVQWQKIYLERLERKKKELGQALMNFAQAYGERDAEIFSLLFCFGKSAKETAGILNLAETTVRHKKAIFIKDLENVDLGEYGFIKNTKKAEKA